MVGAVTVKAETQKEPHTWTCRERIPGLGTPLPGEQRPCGQSPLSSRSPLSHRCKTPTQAFGPKGRWPHAQAAATCPVTPKWAV